MVSVFVRFPVLLSLCFVLPVTSAETQPAATAGANQQTYEYDILREGKPVGSHRVQVYSNGDRTRVQCRSEIEIGLLGLTFYRFRYDSEEVWDERGLRRLLVWVNDDGERLEIDGHRSGARFYWTINDAVSKAHEMPVFPTNHWNVAVVNQTRVLNTLTGRMNRVSIQPLQEDKLVLDLTASGAKKYRYSGELELEAWYDGKGRWTGMRFTGRDGSTIDYRCRNCRTRRSL